MLIHRDYRGYTGGHGKFRDYVSHIDAHPGWRAVVFLTPESTTVDNPFLDVAGLTARWAPHECDAMLVGGLDWTTVPHDFDPCVPVVNLIQHIRHADPDLPWRQYLRRPAIRICNSAPVAEAVLATGEVNGPLLVIPSALDVAQCAAAGLAPIHHDVFVDGAKQPDLARAVTQRLLASGVRVRALLDRVPFSDYLAHMASASIALLLPDATEGIYLPGMHAMAMGRALVQPDCVGSGEYVRADVNALVPPRDPDALADAVRRLMVDTDLHARLTHAGRATVSSFDLCVERQSVHALLDEMENLWNR